ncbi:MAG TPA: hypothetical protein VFX33_00965 [Actinomycetales bacterium]|nr:hypothetical protein [Actinomycetales bacterium]
MGAPVRTPRAPAVEDGAAQARSRVGAAVGMRFQVVGPKVVVDAAHDLMADLFADDYVSAPATSADLLRYHVTDSAVIVNGRRFEVCSAAEAVETMQWHLNQTVVAHATRTMTGLHAAAAAQGGRLVVLPAQSGSGKSTTVAGLVRAGWQYVTDEACLIDSETLRVLPYPKPIGLERGSWRLFPGVPRPVEPHGTWLVPAASLGNAGVCEAQVPAAVVTPRYEPGETTRLHRLSPGELVMELAQSTFSFNEDGGRHLRVLARLARRVPGFRLTISDLDEAVELLGCVAAMEGAR